MAVFQNRPYERHMVSNIPALLPAGLTLADLGVGQIGIFDAKTNKSVTAPTYAVNKAIYIAQGTPDHSNFPEGAGVPNVYRKSHVISGKKIQKLYGKKANRGLNEIVTLGFDGVDTTKTLSAKPGETFYYYVRLTGDPIFNLNPDKSKGVIIIGAVQMPCADECSDNCGTVSCDIISNAIVADWNTKLLVGGDKVSKFVKATPLIACQPTYVNTCYDTCTLSVPDNGTQFDLGQVQAQFPGAFTLSRQNGVTVYGLKDSTGTCPSAFVSPEIVKTTDCASCDSGTLVHAFNNFEVKVATTTGADQSSTINAELITGGFPTTTTTTTLVNFDAAVGVNIYAVTTTDLTKTGANIISVLAAAVTPVAVLEANFIGETPTTCVIAGTSYSWTKDTSKTCCVFEGTYKITLKDSVCGTDWSAQITADYISSGFATNLTVSSAGINCTHEYTIDVYSTCVAQGCSPDLVTFPDVPAFNGEDWTFVSLVTSAPAPTTSCACGVQFESVYVPRVTKEATFDQFAYQTDFVHIEVSSHNPDWRSTDLCETDPVATRIQNGAYPNGNGQAVSRLEKQDRMYDMDYFYMSPVLREAFDFYFETKFDQYYDQVGLEYVLSYSSNLGFGQTDNDTYIQYVWLPEGQTGALTAALNGYVASALIDVDPIII